MNDLKHKVIRGGVAKALAQGSNLVLRMGSLMVLARLLAPTEFGLVGMVMAFTGFGYWALVASAVTLPLVSTLCLWVATGWKPGKIHLHEEVHSMLRFGGAFTLINLIVYVGYNLEKILLGRYWGANALGLYG